MGQPEQDPEVIELSLQLSGLSITVRGSPSRAVDFVRELADSPPLSQASHGYPAAASEAASVLSATSSFGDTRASLLESFPACPTHWTARALAVLSGSNLSGPERARRAWIAGCWARAVNEGRVSSPNRSETIRAQNRFWCVVSCVGLDCPRVFTTSGAFFRAVGTVSGSTTICHAFPSETEARIYLEAAGADYPSGLN